MTKLTTEQKAAAKSLKVAAEHNKRVKEQEEAEKQAAEFRASLPKKLYEMQILATKVGIETYVTLTQTGASVRFSKYEDDSDRYDTVLSYESEEWEVTAMFDTLTSMEAAQAQAAKDLRNAYEIFN